jgi:hypothetical protein
MIRSFTIALLLIAAPNACAQTLADLWDGRAKWQLAAEKVGDDFTFHCLSILPQEETLPHERKDPRSRRCGMKIDHADCRESRRTA